MKLEAGMTETNGIHWWWSVGVLFYFKPGIPKLFQGRVNEGDAEMIVKIIAASRMEFIRVYPEGAIETLGPPKDNTVDLYVPRWALVVEDIFQAKAI